MTLPTVVYVMYFVCVCVRVCIYDLTTALSLRPITDPYLPHYTGLLYLSCWLGASHGLPYTVCVHVCGGERKREIHHIVWPCSCMVFLGYLSHHQIPLQPDIQGDIIKHAIWLRTRWLRIGYITWSGYCAVSMVIVLKWWWWWWSWWQAMERESVCVRVGWQVVVVVWHILYSGVYSRTLLL